MEATVSSLGLGYPFFAGDEIMIKTMVRSNPGFLLISNGAIIGKWGFRDFPSLEELDPHTLELIGNAATPMDEETQLLMEAGIYEDFSFNVLDFESFLPDLVYEKGDAAIERGVVVAFVLGIFLLLLLSGFISPIRT